MFSNTELDLALALGLIAFTLHISAYILYAYHIFHERIRPNAASWFMWLIGGVIEYLTFDAIGESHWSTSALPLACVIGLVIIFSATTYLQLRAYFNPSTRKPISYHHPEKSDYALTIFDLGAGFSWLYWNIPGLANMVAVSTTIISFIPIWKTTYLHNEEHPTPWILWSIAYLCMFGAVIVEGGEGLFFKLFYPGYYFLLHIVMVLLTLTYTRKNFIACIEIYKNFIKN